MRVDSHREVRPLGSTPSSHIAKLGTLTISSTALMANRGSAALIIDTSLFGKKYLRSPLETLYDYTLPKIKHILSELGQERADQIVRALNKHCQKMIGERGIESAGKHLEHLFSALPKYERQLREQNGAENIIEAYRKLYFEGTSAEYLVLFNDDLHKADDNDLSILRLVGNISSLPLNYSRITDAGLAYLAGLLKLWKLELCGTKITDAGLIHVAELKNLRELLLASTEITDTGLLYLAALKKLQVLDIGETQITDAGLIHLAKLTNLQELFLDDTQITDEGLRCLGSLKNLKKLHLGHTQITDTGLTYLADLTDLEQLSLAASQITDVGLPYLANLRNLKTLGLWDTNITNSGLSHLAKLSSLHSLDLYGTQITDAGLRHLARLTNLRELNLSCTQITDDGLPLLASLTNLQILSFENDENGRITENGIKKIKAMLPGVEINAML